MKFRKVTASKYIGEHGYSLIECKDGLFAVCKDNIITSWGTCFTSVKAAEYFMNSHNYIKATTESIPISADDLVFAIDMYGLEPGWNSNQLVRDNICVQVVDDNKTEGPLYLLVGERNGNKLKITTPDELFQFLDQHFSDDDIFASVNFRGTELRSIFAAKLPPKNSGRNARDASRNLVRVKSSNVWAYGIEIKDRKAKEGDVYVQFKGKNGGPGDIYVYFAVQLNVWRRILSATSKGHAVWQFLRNNYLYAKLTGDRRGKLPNAVNNI